MVVGIAEQAPTSSQGQAETSPIAKPTTYAAAFFDSIGQNATLPGR